MDAATLVRRSRERAGLSQRQLAARAETSAAAVCFYESGERVPRIDTLARLLAASGATLELAAEWSAPEIDLVENGRVLEELLELADHLPQRHTASLDFPPLRDLVG